MQKTRRQFVQAAAGSLVGMASWSMAEPRYSHHESGGGLHILILGGTGFIGPHMVESALARGHKVTLFNRGKTNTDLFPQVEKLVGDRDGQLDALNGRQWDAVIDNSGYVPRHVSDSATLLAKAAPHYLFISSISAYDSFATPGMDEDHSLATMPDETVEKVTGATYGPMKALCEKAVRMAYPTGSTIVRPGYIVGPGDRTDRWTYWPVRVARGGAMLVPGNPQDPIQIIDARDLAGFTIRALESRVLGTYNAAGPGEVLTMGRMLNTLRESADSDAEFVWMDAEAVAAHKVSFPIWSAADGDSAGVHRVSNARALAAGMTFTPLATTAADTLAWWQTLDDERRAAMRSGLRVANDGADGFDRSPVSLDQQMALESQLLRELAANGP